MIRDIPSVIPTIDNLIRQLDRKSQQVEIEARVVQASRSFSQDIGVQWGFAGTTTSGRTIFGGAPQRELARLQHRPAFRSLHSSLRPRPAAPPVQDFRST